MRAITLSFPTLGVRELGLRALDGHGELLVDSGDPGAANLLLAALLRERDGSAVDVPRLLATWRDRALAEIYRAEIGENVECRSHCSECGEKFEFAFALEAVMAQQDKGALESGLRLTDDGAFELEGGVRIRPPCLADAENVSDADALAAALILEGEGSTALVEETLELAAPLLAFDLDATCPECETSQQLDFEIGRFLAESLAGERAFLIRETHLIASRYGWDHATIMALPRRDRQAYAGLIESERSSALARRA